LSPDAADCAALDQRRACRPLIEHDLADELRLMVYPFVLGTGEGLFGEISDSKALRLVSAETVGDSLAFLTYRLGA
jgi:dihydrofolate reductase